MKKYQAEVISDIQDDDVEAILHDFGSECYGLPNDCFFAITFYDDGEDDDWTLGWIDSKKKKKVENWIDKNGLSREKEYLIQRCW